MRFISFEVNNEKEYGILVNNENIISFCNKDFIKEKTLTEFIENNGNMYNLNNLDYSSFDYKLSEVKQLAPLYSKKTDVICIGLNYWDHIDESKSAVEIMAGKNMVNDLVVFTKRTTGMIGNGEKLISRLDLDPCLDYEVELGVVIGKDLKPNSVIDESCIFGYTIINDFTAREYQRKHSQWFIGKSFDGYLAMGPAIVTLDEFEDFNNLEMKLYVNGELRQSTRTSLMIKNVLNIIKEINQAITLRKGDVISTGTCGGVACGSPEKNYYLKVGDVVTCEIEGIGRLVNVIS
jgi:2-keto-4-pentenoate hydratase/2-oxohepta-3-ene-1,7-dioic acid hydratase in catechol pathway